MSMASALFEELLDDTRRLTEHIRQYGDRWSTYGDQLGHTASDSQRAELEAVMEEYLQAIRDMGCEL